MFLMKNVAMPLILHGIFMLAFLQSSFAKTSIIEREVSYSYNGVIMKGYVAYDGSFKTKRPAVLVVHEWWGNNEYAHKRAKMLAELGYIAFAMDMYGDGKLADNPKAAGELATPFYQNPQMALERIEAAIKRLMEFPETNPAKVAAIGYCFGGGMLLNAAKMGLDIRGVVSFHGSLNGVSAGDTKVKARILVCHGEADQFVTKEDITNFKHNLDSLKIPYQFISYTNATHAFTNTDATATGQKFNMPIEYNASADKKSWNDMQLFLKKLFI